MAETKNEQEEIPVAEKLASRLERGRKLLAEDKADALRLRFLISPVRAELRRLYGRDSRVVNLFPNFEQGASPERKKEILEDAVQKLQWFLDELHRIGVKAFGDDAAGKIFIGHGRSPLWRELKDFLSERLGLPWDEFNREAVAGITTFERLSQMLDDASFAFLISVRPRCINI